MGEKSFGLNMSNYYISKEDNAQVTTLNLFDLGLEELSKEYYASFFKTKTKKDEEQLKIRDNILKEVMYCDKLVFNVPMWNISVPAYARMFLDALSIPGKTFQYKEDGRIQGLLKDIKVILISTAGGYNHDKHSLNLMIKELFELIGLDDITIIPLYGSARTNYDNILEGKKTIDKIF